jgi:glycosyltransferase involved in cell wall biosynthesis
MSGLKDHPYVDICLATYNGALYVEDLLESILNQSYRHWRLIIHDDGSTDGTTDILRKFESEYSAITLIDDGVAFSDPKMNFSFLLGQTEAGYIMLADQDDVWLPEKIAKSLSKVTQEEECLEGDNIPPIVVFGDLIVTDRHLHEISPSLWSLNNVDIERSNEISYIAFNNPVTGCAAIMNRSALNVSLPVPDVALMHDWWIAICTLKYGGCLVELPDRLIYYRQHGANQVGASLQTKRPVRFDGVNFFLRNIRHYKMLKHAGVYYNFYKFFLDKLGCNWKW